MAFALMAIPHWGSFGNGMSVIGPFFGWTSRQPHTFCVISASQGQAYSCLSRD